MSSNTQKQTRRFAVSGVLKDGELYETVVSKAEALTRFAHYDGEVHIKEHLDLDLHTLIPISASNNLIKHSALIFAEKPESFVSLGKLVMDVQEYIHRYVDLSDHFLKIASYYVLLTWVYDAFNELPYLRFRGDFGSGKTRALLIIGSICNKAFFASGASTTSPIFHVLDTFRGTLIFDEADFRFSDEKSELIKIFNNGNVKGFPVLRTAITAAKEFDPRAFNVFGPKVVAMRKAFDDPALESRFITEEMGQRSLRRDIPINLPESQTAEATTLRNKLLMYRFKMLGRIKVNEANFDPSLSPRLNQIIMPLLSIIEHEALRKDIRDSVRSFEHKLSAERSGTIEAWTLAVLLDLGAQDCWPIPVSTITEAYRTRYADEYEKPITPRIIGNVLRSRLRLMTYKSHGVYVLPITEKPKINELCLRYGVLHRSEVINSTAG
jgi:hypothetical protein